jgi:hypothetical protein
VKSWLSWRLAVGSVLCGMVFTILLFWWARQRLSLSGLDLFFAITTVISFGFNLWQLFRDKYKYTPLRNSLIGLFNDLKSRQARSYQLQPLIVSPPVELSLDAVRFEFYDFVQENIQGLEQLREHVVAGIYTLDPEASTQEVFRASEFGLTEGEKAFRQEWMERTKADAQKAAESLPQPNNGIEQAAGTSPKGAKS